jgi:hypothetical protein
MMSCIIEMCIKGLIMEDEMVRHVAQIGEKRTAYRVLLGSLEKKG